MKCPEIVRIAEQHGYGFLHQLACLNPPQQNVPFFWVIPIMFISLPFFAAT
jgi:hypothetical protein